jgi:hypothetical protein
MEWSGKSMIKFEVKGLDRFQDRLIRELNTKANIKIKTKMDHLLDALIINTPIDTGYARSRWKYDTEQVFRLSFSFANPAFVKFIDTRQVVVNDAPYIQYLNEGWSKQAPPRYIEQTMLQHGFKPVRLI